MWSSPEFLNQLPKAEQAPRFFLESIPGGFAYSGGHPLGGIVRLSSSPEDGYIECIQPDGCSMQHARLQPGTWARSHGTLTIQTSLDPTNVGHAEEVRSCVRGQFFRLDVELVPGGRETVWVGVLRNVRWSMSGGFVLELVELIGGLTTRNTRDSARAPLFSGLSTTTVATLNYVAAAASITVADSSGFERETGGTWLIRVTPNTGDPFYLTGAFAGAILTIAVRGAFDTTDANADIGALVEEIAYIPRHPIHTALRVLCSTGLGTNGPYDLLPERWGLGIWTELVDHTHAVIQKARLVSDQYVAYARSDAAEPNGLEWLAGHLQPFGLFLAMRQGQITVMAVQSIHLYLPEATITDHDIAARGLEHEAYDGDSPTEAGSWTSTYGTPDATAELSGDAIDVVDEEDTVASRPVVDPTWEVPDVFRSSLALGITADAQITAWSSCVPNRLSPWALRPPERVTVRLHRWTHAGLCLGDNVELQTRFLVSRLASHTFADGRKALVVGGGPDWFRGGMTLELLIYPEMHE